ncbi:MAG TPA: methionyl-tRNA formyltransferase [Salinivirgaceae bacterium]|nr:methionyl-tRNA formyltransferase [Salinivirgaceae bacterium]
MTADNFKIVFMGTPDFAVESLEILHQNFNIVAVVTSPDKPRGRGQKLTPSPVKEFAQSVGLPVLQPTNLKSSDFIEALSLLNPDLGVIVAFRMLPESVWSLPRLGSINLHASLLPQYRGAAPINHAIINGETKTGVTTFFLKHEIDTGNIIDSKEVPILPTDNAGTLHDKLMIEGAKVLYHTVESIIKGNYKETPQNVLDNESLKDAPKLNKEFCRINWNAKGEVIHNFIRGLNPYPGAYTETVLADKTVGIKIYDGFYENSDNSKAIGTVVSDKNSIKVAVSNGWYHITELQQAGKKRMSVVDFLNGLNNQSLEKFENLS